ncbi:MAG: PhoH family protein [Oscillospiraceae bacterium]|nr:PhoH family protein [Oscillospiraceae bacterium]
MTEKIISTERMETLADVFGSLDENLRVIESEFSVKVFDRDSTLRVIGEAEDVNAAVSVIESLMSIAVRGSVITAAETKYIAGLAKSGDRDKITDFINGDVVCVTAKGKPIKAKTLGQKKYAETIQRETITLAVGPAGTGKTYLAVASAVTAFRAKKINRIILTRPAVEAGERLGFLPGDLQSKVDPYLRPLYDALFDMFGAENYQKYLDKGYIEVAPLAYMRGRTLDDSFIILDEAQNTSREQMKMFLTRLGANSKAVITGDVTQIDLPPDKVSGLKDASKVLKGVPGIGIVNLTGADVVRHPLVQLIIAAYEKRSQGK